MKKHFSKLTLALILALVMGLAFAAPALAEGPQPLEGDDLLLGITKTILSPPGTAVPDSTFIFEFEQFMVGPEGGLVPRGTGPAGNTVPGLVTIADQTITFPADQVGPDANVGQVGGSTPPLGFDMGTITWPHAGDFFFVITERANTNPAIDSDPLQSMTYDNRAWLLIVSVGNFTIDGAEVPRIVQIQVARFTPPVWNPPVDGYPGYWYPEGSWSDAKEPYYRPGVWNPPVDGYPGYWEVPLSSILFENTYVDNRTDPDAYRLVISKAVGYNRTFADLTTDFAFTAVLTIPVEAVVAHLDPGNTFTLPATITANTQEQNAAGNWVNVSPAVPVTFTLTAVPAGATGADITGFTYVPAADFLLRDGQRLAFPSGVPAGTTVSVTERALENWALESAYFDGRTRAEWAAAPGAYGSTITVDTATLDPVGTVTSAGSEMDLTNRFFRTTITGLVIGSMPFMVALLGATVLLAMMVASRSRQRIEQLPIAY